MLAMFSPMQVARLNAASGNAKKLVTRTKERDNLEETQDLILDRDYQSDRFAELFQTNEGRRVVNSHFTKDQGVAAIKNSFIKADLARASDSEIGINYDLMSDPKISRYIAAKKAYESEGGGMNLDVTREYFAALEAMPPGHVEQVAQGLKAAAFGEKFASDVTSFTPEVRTAKTPTLPFGLSAGLPETLPISYNFADPDLFVANTGSNNQQYPATIAPQRQEEFAINLYNEHGMQGSLEMLDNFDGMQVFIPERVRRTIAELTLNETGGDVMPTSLTVNQRLTNVISPDVVREEGSKEAIIFGLLNNEETAATGSVMLVEHIAGVDPDMLRAQRDRLNATLTALSALADTPDNQAQIANQQAELAQIELLLSTDTRDKAALRQMAEYYSDALQVMLGPAGDIEINSVDEFVKKHFLDTTIHTSIIGQYKDLQNQEITALAVLDFFDGYVENSRFIADAGETRKEARRGVASDVKESVAQTIDPTHTRADLAAKSVWRGLASGYGTPRKLDLSNVTERVKALSLESFDVETATQEQLEERLKFVEGRLFTTELRSDKNAANAGVDFVTLRANFIQEKRQLEDAIKAGK